MSKYILSFHGSEQKMGASVVFNTVGEIIKYLTLSKRVSDKPFAKDLKDKLHAAVAEKGKKSFINIQSGDKEASWKLTTI